MSRWLYSEKCWYVYFVAVCELNGEIFCRLYELIELQEYYSITVTVSSMILGVPWFLAIAVILHDSRSYGWVM